MAKYKLVKTLLYQSEEGAVEGEFIIGDETLWASRKVVAEIFNTSNQNISHHFLNIVSEGELEEKEVSISSKELFKDDSEFSKKFLQNSKNGGRPQIWYNLDAIISIGYRVNSKEATKFRIWSRGILKQYMRKGYVLNKDLLIMVDDLLMTILITYLKKSGILDLLKGKYMKKSRTYLPHHMITIKMQK